MRVEIVPRFDANDWLKLRSKAVDHACSVAVAVGIGIEEILDNPPAEWKRYTPSTWTQDMVIIQFNEVLMVDPSTYDFLHALSYRPTIRTISRATLFVVRAMPNPTNYEEVVGTETYVWWAGIKRKQHGNSEAEVDPREYEALKTPVAKLRAAFRATKQKHSRKRNLAPWRK